MTGEADVVTRELVDAVCVLTLNRPERRNAITRDLLRALTAQLRAEAADVRAFVVTGAGSAFCSGADLQEAMNPQPGDVPYPTLLHEVARTMRGLDVPVIAALNGPALGAGLGLALMADLRVMAEDATVAESYIRIGTFPGPGDTRLLPELVGVGQALRLLWTADRVDAAQALRLGLVEQLAPPGRARAEAVELATRIAGMDTAVVGRIKHAVYASRTLDLDASLDLAASYSAMRARTHRTSRAPGAEVHRRAAERRRAHQTTPTARVRPGPQ